MSVEQKPEIQQTEETKQVEETKKEDWSVFIDGNEKGPKKEETEEKKDEKTKKSFYQLKYNESDWVLMFSVTDGPLETWIVRDFLDEHNIKPRGIRQGKSGNCFSDFEDEETMKKVKDLSGSVFDDKLILIEDVPPRKDGPKNKFNKKKPFNGEKKGKFTKTTKYSKGPKKPFEKKDDPFDNLKEQREAKEKTKQEVIELGEEYKPVIRKKATKKMVQFDPSKTHKKPTTTKPTTKVAKPEEKEKKKVTKKVVKEPELNEEEKEDGWEIVTKGSKIGTTKKKEKKTLEGVVNKKSLFE